MRYFLAGLLAVLFLGVGLVSYGSYLNYRGEKQIATRMADQTMSLFGERVQVRNIYPRITLDTLRLSAEDMADAVALVNGRVTQVAVKKNEYVHAGQLLFELECPGLPARIKQAESNVMKAQTDLVRARNTYERYVQLKAYDATSAVKFDEVESAYHAAEANLEAAVAQKEELLVQEEQQRVTSPIDGEVLILYRPQGAYVQSGTSVALVGDFRILRFSTPIRSHEAEPLALSGEGRLFFNHDDFDKVYDTEYHAGNHGDSHGIRVRVLQISPPLEEPATLRKVLWEVDNSTGILEPQTYGGVELVSSKAYSRLTIPLSALTDAAHHEVFVYREDGTIWRRAVKTGFQDGNYIEVLDGLSEGEIVITSDAEGLVDGMRTVLNLEEGKK